MNTYSNSDQESVIYKYEDNDEEHSDSEPMPSVLASLPLNNAEKVPFCCVYHNREQ
jgi:hypothetical protein